MYCQHCGNPTSDPAEAEAEVAGELAGAQADVADTISSSEVEIARINADRDITLAKIERGMVDNAVEAAAETAATEDAVKADILDQIIEPSEPEPVPVVMDDVPADAGPSEEPPPVVDAEPEPAGKRNSNPWW